MRNLIKYLSVTRDGYNMPGKELSTVLYSILCGPLESSAAWNLHPYYAIALQTDSREFDIPFNRQQLADYLNLERTNMSKELSRMQDEGLIEYRKSHFRLLKADEPER